MKLLTINTLTDKLMNRMDRYNNDYELSQDSQISILGNKVYIKYQDIYIFNSSKNRQVSNYWINVLLPVGGFESEHDVIGIDLRQLYKEYEISEKQIALSTEPKQVIKIFEYISKENNISITKVIDKAKEHFITKIAI
jgi:hypothetical protein